MCTSAGDLVDSLQAELPRQRRTTGAIAAVCVSNQSLGLEPAGRVEEAPAFAALATGG